jgi:hypothetical protein
MKSESLRSRKSSVISETITEGETLEIASQVNEKFYLLNRDRKFSFSVSVDY